MQIKSKILILGAIATLVALALIQWYLISNSYELQRKTFKMDAFSAIAGFSSTEEIKEIGADYQNHVLAKLPELDVSNPEWKANIKSALVDRCRELNPRFKSLFQERLSQLKIEVDLQIILHSIVFKDSLGGYDTVFIAKEDSALTLLGSDLDPNDGNGINTREWQQDIDLPNLPSYRQFLLTTKIYMHLDNWKSAVFRELFVLYLAVFIMLSFVIALVAYSIHNLIKHKNLSDVQSDFINNITHELKTPLTTQKISLKQLDKLGEEAKLEPSQSSKFKAITSTLNRQNFRLEKLIDQVVNLSLGYRELKLNKEQLPIAHWLEKTVDDYAIGLPKEVQLEKNIQDFDCSITGDDFHLSTCIVNLLGNAVKYGAKKVAVEAYAEGGQYKIVVSDNGIGIDKKHHQLIFDKFYRVSEKNQHNYKGLGLGLYYCYQSIAAHFGNIEVESSLGEGSRFTITLPLNTRRS